MAAPTSVPAKPGTSPEDVIRRIGDTNERALAYVLEPDPQLNRLSRKVREEIITDLPPVTAGALLGPAALARHFVASAASGRYRDLFPLWQLFRLRPDDCRPVLAERQKALEKGRLALTTAVRLGLSGHAERVAEDVTRAEGLIWQWLREALLAELPAVGQRPVIASALLAREPALEVPLPAEPDDRWLAEAAAARAAGPLAPPVEALLGANAHRLPATISTLSLAWEHYPERVAELVSRIDLASPSIGALLAWARDHALGDRVATRIHEDVKRAAQVSRADGLAAWYAWRQRGVDVELPEALQAHTIDDLDVSRPETAALAAALIADGAPFDMQGIVAELATRNRQLAEKAYEAFVCAGLDVTLPAALQGNPLVKEGTRCPWCGSWTYVRAGHERRCPRRPEPSAVPEAAAPEPATSPTQPGPPAPPAAPPAEAWDAALAEAEALDAAAADPPAPSDPATEAGPAPQGEAVVPGLGDPDGPGPVHDTSIPPGMTQAGELVDAAAFPKQYARTRRFSLGAPRTITVSPDGERVVFLRSLAGDDPTTSLWVLTTADGVEHQVGDTADLGEGDGLLTAEERLRRERVRESASGVVSYATDREVTVAVFAVGGVLFTADLREHTLTRVNLPTSVADPVPSPDGGRVAFAADRGVFVMDVGGAGAAHVVEPEDDPQVTWGLAEFVAAEEMDRQRGLWWSPEGDRLAVARVDVSGVQRWYLADPVDPAVAPASAAYPAAGTPNADVSLHLVTVPDGERVEVRWDRGFFPYLADVVWQPDGPLTLVVQSRDQRTLRLLAVDTETGATEILRERHDRQWTDLVPGVPRWLPDGRLVDVVDLDDTASLAVAGEVLTPPGLQVRAVLHAGADELYVSASREPTSIGVWRIPLNGDEGAPVSAEPGVAGAAAGGATVVLCQRDLATPGARVVVHSRHGDAELRSLAQRPALAVRVELLTLGRRELRGALVLPHGWREGDPPLPVLLDPYGGPHAQRVLASADGYLTSQWFAESGFAVLVVDGRGTPGRGPRWERAVAGDLAGPVLEDQVDGLQAAAQRSGALDLTRVGIRGWSFGGYLAALAVLRRPDVFHAAIAGAPVSDWSLYDTHYTERYLGDPSADADAYRRSSLLADAPGLSRPLLLIHGLADDNVVSAHTLRLSRALLEAGRPHRVLPLSGVTHMTPQELVAEHLLHLQLAFLRETLIGPTQE